MSASSCTTNENKMFYYCTMFVVNELTCLTMSVDYVA